MSRIETQLKVYMAAVELIAEQGYSATTVDAIAERAGVAKGTVFYNFGSKEALFAALLEHGIDRLTEALQEAGRQVAPPPEQQAPGRETAADAEIGNTAAHAPEAGDETRGTAPAPPPSPRDADRVVTGGEVHWPQAQAQIEVPLRRLDAVVMAQLRFFDQYGAFARVLLAEMWRTTWQDAVTRLRAQAIGVYADVLRQAVAAGLLRADLDIDTAATAVFGMVLTVSIERRVLHPDRPVSEAHTTLVDLIHGRISGPASTGSVTGFEGVDSRSGTSR